MTCSGRSGQIQALTKNYDLILLDILLPDIDGFRILKNIRKLKSTPVIMISAQGDKDVVNFFLRAGANDYVIKPFICKDVLERIKKQLNLHFDSLQ